MADLKWVTLFDSMNAKAAGKEGKTNKKTAADPVMSEEALAMMEAEAGGGGKKGHKRLSVERIYQKKTQLEHILLRPDTYIGSVEKVTTNMWVMDEDRGMMIQREVTYVPGLYKIFDEILVNAADNKQRDPNMNCIKIDIDPENNKIKIWNNGKGIPVVEHKDEQMFVPTMIFGHLLTSSNYNDEQKKVTGGRNGYGAKLCNIFSNKFIVETSSKDYNKSFKQIWADNMCKMKEPSIHPTKGDDYTAITFHPDLSKFHMETLDKDIVDIFTRRAYDIAAASKGVKVFLNGKRLPVKSFRDYVDLFIKDKTDDNDQPLKIIYENVNPRWEVALTLSEKGFQQASFVNSIATTKGGRHVDYVTDQIVTKLIEVVKKKNKGGVAIKPFQIKNHIWVFVNCLIENPTFDSQTKENMTLQAKKFGSKCDLSPQFMNQAVKCGIIEGIMTWMKFKAQSQLQKKCHASKHSKLKGIPKLDDANDAGTKNSLACTLILTEGDSAKSLAVAGLGVIGRDRYGVFPLKGKVLNVREATHKQIMDNAEINNLIKIMGLQFKEKYDDRDRLKTLRYGKIMIMTDQDQDGSHIKGLLINFIHHFWPNLLKFNVVEEFITPIVKVTKGKNESSFYSLPEFEEWKKETNNWHTWKIKYYKGLGTSTAKEAKEYFSDMQRHRIPFKYSGTEDDASIVLAFSKKKIEERKQWLTNWMEERTRRAELGLPELYLYGKETKNISYNEFVNRELVLFSNMDNVRSIPSVMDGFKPGQRKVMFTCFKRNDKKEVKVAQLAGSVAELSAYHHGEASLMGTIINLAQNFVGSNNVNVLQPLGQFGTRLHGGKDAASPRYIFTLLSPLARILFSLNDDPLLKSQYDDNQKIEPEYYVPIIPMVLVNGAEGIGTGWSTKIPNHDVREVVANVKRLMDGEEPVPMIPSFKNFKGSIDELMENRYVISGEISIVDDETLEITELPVRSWTQNYKEEVLEPMLHGSEKTQPMITDYKEYHTDSTVKFVVKMAPAKLAEAEAAGLHKVFKIQTTMTANSMVLFDHNGCIKKYSSTTEIMREFYDLRCTYYQRRKDYLEGMLASESLRLDNIARFILEKIEGKIVIENKPKKELIQLLVRRGYDSDPVKAWKEAQNKLEKGEDDDDEDADSEASGSAGGPDFNYLLGMPLWNLTKEKKDELLRQRDVKSEELSVLRRKSPKDMWMEDLESFLTELDRVEEQEREEAKDSTIKPAKGKMGQKPAKQRKLPMAETRPSPMGHRVAPRIDSAMKQKAQKAATKGKKEKLLKEIKFEDDDGDDDDDGDVKQSDMFRFLKKEVKDEENDEVEPKSLADRLNLGADKPKPTRKPKAAGRAKAGAGAGAGAGAAKPKKAEKKKRKGKDQWATDSEEDGSDLDSDAMDNGLDASYVSPDRGPRRQAAAKVKYTFSDKSESESDDDDFKSTENHTTSGGHKAIVMSDSDDDPFVPEPTANERADSSGATGDRLKEGSAINQSLSTLGNVIKALADVSSGKKKVIVPYRNSVLTRLLQNALGGNSKTVMIAALSPADINFEETLSTLRFANRAKAIKTMAIVNESPTDKLIRELKEENARLLEMLKNGGSPSMPASQGEVQEGYTKEEVEEMKRTLEEEMRKGQQELESMKKSWEQRLAEAEADTKIKVAHEKEKMEQRKVVPHFWNLSEDPALTAMVIHFCRKGSSKVGNGSGSATPEILLKGLSIQADHAVLTNKDGAVTLKPCSAAKVLVNGELAKLEKLLHHNDRVMFGSNHLYVFHHPQDEAKQLKEGKKVVSPTFDSAQEEIAESSGFGILMGHGDGKSKDDLLLMDDLLQILPMVNEANAMSEELDKKAKFEVALVSPQSRGLEEGRTEVMVKLKHLVTGNDWMWDRNKFINRKYLMQEMYQNYMEGDKDWDLPKEKDPFWEPADVEILIGTVHLYLQSLAYMIELEDDLVISDYKGNEKGRLSVAAIPCTDKWKEIKDDFVDDPKELVGMKCFNIKMKIPFARGLPANINSSYCRFKFYLDKEFSKTREVNGTTNPNYNHEKKITFKPITKQFVEYLEHAALLMEVWGRQKDTGYGTQKDRGKMSTRDLMAKDKLENPMFMPKVGGGIKSQSENKDDDAAEEEAYKTAAEVNTYRKRAERAETKLTKFQKLFDEAHARNETTIQLSKLEEVLGSSHRFKGVADVMVGVESMKHEEMGQKTSQACSVQ